MTVPAILRRPLTQTWPQPAQNFSAHTTISGWSVLLICASPAWDAQDREAEQEADFRLHSAVVDASHNTTLIHMMASVFDLTRRGIFYNRDLLRSIDGTGRKLLDQHLGIIAAIEAGDAALADKAARDHLDFVEQSIRLGRELQRRERRARMRLNSAE